MPSEEVTVSYTPTQNSSETNPNVAVVTFAVHADGLEVPVLSMPIGFWEVHWQLVVDRSIVSEFGGVQLPSLPAGLSVVQPLAQVNSSRWKITFQNQASELSEFSYNINLVDLPEHSKKKVNPDPTIVVTTDPIGPPTV